jgi:hypothetical protein
MTLKKTKLFVVVFDEIFTFARAAAAKTLVREIPVVHSFVEFIHLAKQKENFNAKDFIYKELLHLVEDVVVLVFRVFIQI